VSSKSGSAGAEAPVQYAPRTAAIIVYLYAGQFLSKQRTALALGELFGIPLSSGTVAALTARAGARLDGFLEHVRGQIAASEVAGFDETGFRVEGHLAWVHCARTGRCTLLMVHPRAAGRRWASFPGSPGRRPRCLGGSADGTPPMAVCRRPGSRY
jgi:transposase